LLSIVVAPIAPSGQLEKAADGAQRIRQGHDRAAMQDAAGGAEIIAHEQSGDDAIGRRCFDLNAHWSRERHGGTLLMSAS